MFTEISPLNLIAFMIFPAVMAFVAASDLLTMRIANWAPLLLLGVFAVLVPSTGLSPSQIAMHVAAGATILAVGFACFSFGWMGGGDAKIAAVTALWFGWFHTVEYLLLAALFGGALTLALLYMRSVPLPTAVAGIGWIRKLWACTSGVPYGIALAFAALMVYPKTVWMAAIVN